jgi:hypothetical membrane protein
MVNQIVARARKQNTVQIWSLATALGVVIYVAIDIVLAFLRPDYSWLHNAESDYGRGPYFWLMDINFLLRCLLSLALVKVLLINFPKNKLIKRASFWLILWAVMSGLLAFFADNPYGYPKLQSGSIHLLIAFIAFFAALVTMVLFNRLKSVMRLSHTTIRCLIALTVIAFVSIVLLGHSGFRPHSFGGLYERVFLLSVLVWEVVLALSINGENKRA